mmetsp:Transcript_18390/g.35835  ORF Transcript_18390/g.35835 Transcript_18390/m.35835 type:complete len:259 (+) Transcript_18390:1058-1834(+)
MGLVHLDSPLRVILGNHQLVQRLVKRVVDHDFGAICVLKLSRLPFLVPLPVRRDGGRDPPLLVVLVRYALVGVREEKLQPKVVLVEWKTHKVGSQQVEGHLFVEPLRDPARLQLLQVAVAPQVQLLAHHLAVADHPSVPLVLVQTLLVHSSLFLLLFLFSVEKLDQLALEQVLPFRLVDRLYQHLQRRLPHVVDVADHGVIEPRVRPVQLRVDSDGQITSPWIVPEALDRERVHRHPQRPPASVALCALAPAAPRHLG